MSIAAPQNISAYQGPSFLPQSIQAVKSCCIEVLVSSLAIGTACLFAATPQVAISLVVFTVAILAVNIFSKMVAIIFEGSCAGSNHAATPLTQTCKMIPPFTHALVFGTTGNVLFHEGGHYGAISLIHTHANSQVTIDNLFEGSTTWITGQYTVFGKLLGSLNSRLVIAAAGPLLAVCFATIGIIVALHLGENFPDLSKSIFFSSNFSIIGHLSYAFSAFSADPNDLAHDFVMLWHCGIHPLVSAVCLIAIPTIAVLVYLYNKNKIYKTD
jgi:hypothetical protein